MLSENQATEIARKHVAAQPSPAPGYSIALGRMAVVELGWYFDYRIECKLNIPEDEREQFASALGFLVDRKSGDISIVSHSEWVDLGLAFHDNPYGDPDNVD